MKTPLLTLLGGLLLGIATTHNASAVLIESLNNTIANGTITIDSSRSGWAGLTGFVTDPNEGLTEDWHQVTIANDSNSFYIRYQMNASAGWTGAMHMYIDTDLNRTTGFIGGDSQFSVGAEFMIEGGSLYSFSGGSQTTWGWNWISYTGNGDVANDYEIGVLRSALAVSTFNFVLDAESNGGFSHDYYVDSAASGASGGFLQYTTNPIPEPGTAALFGIGLAWMMLRRPRQNR